MRRTLLIAALLGGFMAAGPSAYALEESNPLSPAHDFSKR